ncbi:D-alanyl-D-alanine carboxypeptidase/D-alanyl-D-alanine-endopeptidase [soil metagenome]
MRSDVRIGTRRAVIAVVAVGLVLAACSDDASDSAGPTTTAAASTTAEVTATTTSGGTESTEAETTEPETGSESTDPDTTESESSTPESSTPESGGSPIGGSDVPPEVASVIEEILAKDEYRHSTWGVMVRDEETGDVLVDVNGDTMFVTGSILKTLSAAGVLEAYGPDHTFATPVYGVGAVDGGVLRGDLVLVASGGDFNFGLRDQPDGTLEYASLPVLDHNEANTGLGAQISPTGDPFAAFDELSAQIADAGITAIEGEVVIDDRIFEAFTGWPDGIIAPIWFNENVVDITIAPGAAAGDPATVTWKPETAAFTVQSSVTTVGQDEEAGELVASLASPGVIEVTGGIAFGADPAPRIYKVDDPSAWARTAFVESLSRAGITVAAAATGPNPADLLPTAPYDEAQKLAEHTSAPLAELVKVILKVSYNRGADLLVCLTAVSNGSTQCPDGIAPTITTIESLGIEDRTTFMFDGAGSDERDRTTPGSMTEFLRGVSEAPWGAAFEDGLPILGEDGTLATNQAGTPAAGNVFAKTGTRVGFIDANLGIATGLTQVGYVDAASGRRLTYAVMVRDVPLGAVTEFFAIDEDQGEIAAAIQANF